MSVLLTFGLALTIEGILNITAGNKFKSATPATSRSRSGSARCRFPKPQVYGFLAAVLVLAALYVVLTRTWTGRAIRASSQNPSGAALVGIGATVDRRAGLRDRRPPRRGSAARSCRCSTRSSRRRTTTGSRGCSASSCSAAWARLPGALAGALVLGLAETLTATYGSLRWATLVFYIVILAVLLFRPQGLFGTRLREDVAA